MARKVNSKFLLILSLVVAGLVVVVGAFVYYRHKHHNPKQFLAIAEKAEQSGETVLAAQNYITAGQLLRDPNLMVKAGDMFNQSVYDDVENLAKAQQCWDLAISTDPNCMPALERELHFWQEVFRLNHNNPSPRLYDNLKDVSQKILKINPKHVEARSAVPIAAIDSWVHHFENDQTVIDAAVKQLVDLQADAPDNADIPFYIAAAYATEASAADRDGKPTVAAKLREQAISTIQQAMKDHNNSAVFHDRAGRIYINDPVLATQKDKIELKRNRIWMEYRIASELVKADDPDYDEIKLSAATYALDGVAGDSVRVLRGLFNRVIGIDPIDSVNPEKIFREVLKQRPTDLQARNKLGDLLGSRAESRDEAIDLLKTLPDPAPADRIGPRGQETKNMELQCLVTLTNLRLDKLMALSSKSEQDVLMPQVQADFRKLNAKAPDNPYVLRIKAKLQMAQGQITDAIATLDPAIAKTTERDPMHFELMFLSARCYLMTNQSGSAKKYLQQIVDSYPSYEPARILLTQTQLREFDFENADKNIEWLKENDPENMDVVRMEIAVLLQQKKTDEAKKVYDRLPEQTRNQRLGKATVAILLNIPDEDKRLIDSVLAADPGDVQASLMLSAFYSHAKDNTNAVAALDRALKVKPDNTDLMLERARLGGSSVEQMKQIRLREAQKISDPLERELALMDLTRDEADENVPLQHLQAAEKLNPKDSRVLTALFEYNLARRNWDQAKTYADRLSQINADKVNGTLFYWRLALNQAQTDQDSTKQRDDLAKALDLATQLTHDFPEFAQTWLCMGQTLTALGRFEDAVP
ncbi:MAG TPA: tetratricopeptide repeat protein, partial [Tepidisphaeraceae bacterium]|nr:tetratricopeptide repeat protein [Tepidisphaeraceae bacterium]